MKYLLLIIFIILCLASAGNYLSRPEVRSEVPIVYWVTETHDARVRNLEKFHHWLRENNYPEFEVRIDNASNDVSKKLMQGVSGVGADLIHLARDEAWFLSGTGMLEDLTPYAKEHGFEPKVVWKRAQNNLILNGKQVGFPRSISIQIYFVNKDLLARQGIEELPEFWNLEEFERIGKEFVASANDPGERQEVFFADAINDQGLRRSLGVSMFNETMTECLMDDPNNVKVFHLFNKWTNEDHILPSQADLDFATGSGTTTSRLQLFLREKYALTVGARYTLVRLREADVPFRYGVQEGPIDHFRNSPMGTGSIGIYAASEYKDLAAYLLEYFTSETHNMHVVEEADGMPIIPKYVEAEAFLRPPDHPEEWGMHAKFADVLRNSSLPPSVSPYILPTTANRIAKEMKQAMVSGIYSAEEASVIATERINAQIELNLKGNAALQKRYEAAVENQKKIDQYRAEGKLVPLEWIENPFHREYYVYRGWSEAEENQQP